MNDMMDSLDSINVISSTATFPKEELAHLMVDTLKSSLVQFNLEKEQNCNDEDVESIDSNQSSLKSFNQKIDDEVTKTFQSDLFEIIRQSKEEIIEQINDKWIDSRKEDSLSPRSKQKHLFEEDQKEQKQYEQDMQITLQSKQVQTIKTEASLANQLLFLEPEFDKLSSKMDLNQVKMDSFVTCTQFNDGINKIIKKMMEQQANQKDSKVVTSKISLVQNEIGLIHEALAKHSNHFEQINKNNQTLLKQSNNAQSAMSQINSIQDDIKQMEKKSESRFDDLKKNKIAKVSSVLSEMRQSLKVRDNEA